MTLEVPLSAFLSAWSVQSHPDGPAELWKSNIGLIDGSYDISKAMYAQ